VLAPFENFAGTRILLFDFDVCRGFLIKILPYFFCVSLFSQLHRVFFFALFYKWRCHIKYFRPERQQKGVYTDLTFLIVTVK